jgi:hypothetical protein
LIVQHGARQLPGQPATKWDAMWVWGFAAPSVAEVTIVTTGCRLVTLTPDADGVFMHVFGQAEQAEGWPFRVQALTASRGLLASRPITFRPPATDAARAAGITAPQPSAACS